MEWLCAFKVRRDGSDRTGIRTALRRLEKGGWLAFFLKVESGPERDLYLNGAPMWPGVSALCVLSGKPIVPGVILGTDRLYHKANWFPFRRVPVWIGFGEAIFPRTDVPRGRAREVVQESLAGAFVSLKERLMLEFRLSEADLPTTPQARKQEDYLP